MSIEFTETKTPFNAETLPHFCEHVSNDIFTRFTLEDLNSQVKDNSTNIFNGYPFFHVITSRVCG